MLILYGNYVNCDILNFCNMQRWNHHRLAKGMTSQCPVLPFYTDDDYYGICARCNSKNIGNKESVCPNCDLFLGPAVEEAELGWDSTKCSYITYSCRLSSLEFVVGGIGPTIVYEDPKKEWMANKSGVPTMQGWISSVLVGTKGNADQCKELLEKGLEPQLGDVVVSVQDVTLLHLDEHEVSAKGK